MKNIFKSKKIEDEQKLPLMLNEGLTTATTSSVGYVIYNKLNKGQQKFINTFKQVNPKLYSSDPKGWENGLKYAKTIVIFGFIYRCLGPVVVTPIANKLSNMIASRNKQNQQPAKQIAKKPEVKTITVKA